MLYELYHLYVIGLSTIILIALLIFAAIVIKRDRYYRKRFSAIIDVDEEISKLNKDKSSASQEIADLKESYKQKKLIFDRLVSQMAIYDEEIEFAELGFYKPQYSFDTSDQFKEKIKEVKDRQKLLIRDKTAITCGTEWTVEGSKAKGRTMTNRGIRLSARAFNNECDAAISKVKWNNATRMILRIEKAYEAINKLNETNRIQISYPYLKLKLEELQLTHEYHEKRQKEKEEQSELRRQMKEEAKLQKELENAIKEEDKYNRLLKKAELEAKEATGEKLDSLNAKIETLQRELTEAHEKSERAKSMAEQTKRGHVYIISNVGSFGDETFKIGMTRRLEPLDRVKELSDASVPFIFDLHAMIFSEDAPALENALHKKFEEKRINLVNNRKEFFRVTFDEIKEEIRKISPDSDIIEKPEAREYRETQAIIKQKENIKDVTSKHFELPDEI